VGQYEAGSKDNPIKIAGGEITLAVALRTGEGGCTARSGTDRRDVDDTSNALLLARRKQCRWCINVDAPEIVAETVLKRAYAVHDGVNSNKPFVPRLRCRYFLKVSGDPVGIRKSSAGFCYVAASSDQVMALETQP
jgi:hypothetical protein